MEFPIGTVKRSTRNHQLANEMATPAKQLQRQPTQPEAQSN